MEQKRYEIQPLVTRVLTQFGKSKTRVDDAQNLQTDPASRAIRILDVDDALHRFCAPGSHQRPRSKRKHHHLHPRIVPSSGTVLGDGRLRAKDPIREPSRQTRLLRKLPAFELQANMLRISGASQ